MSNLGLRPSQGARTRVKLQNCALRTLIFHYEVDILFKIPFYHSLEIRIQFTFFLAIFIESIIYERLVAEIFAI